MARVVKEHAARLSEILTVSQRLIYTKGYEQMTIQDILDELKISKGAFYHYFDSKQALLEDLIEHMMQEAELVVLPIVDDPQMPALEKFQRFFDSISRWKTARKAYLLAILRGWYSDDNTIVRQKVNAAAIKRFGPALTIIIRQGIHEGVMHNPYPDQVASVIFSIMFSFGDSFGEYFLPDGLDESKLESVENALAVFVDAVERVLGTPQGSMNPIDEATLREWIRKPEETGAASESEGRSTLPAPVPHPASQEELQLD